MRGIGGIAKLLIALTIALFSISVVSGATVTSSFNKTYSQANDTTQYINLTGLSSVTNAYVEFKYAGGGSSNFDNSGGGSWSKWAGFTFTSATTEYAQYKLVISGTTWELYNSSGSLEGSGTVSDFWSSVNSDGSDIRVFNQSGDQLYFWLESFDYAGQTATIWVKVTAGSTELNIAYGNSLATTSAYESATQVFDQIDDFEDADITDWSFTTGTWSATTASAYEGSYGLEETATTPSLGWGYKTVSFSLNAVVLEYYARQTEATGGNGLMLVNTLNAGSPSGYLLWIHPGNDVLEIYRVDSGTVTLLSSASYISDYNTWYKLKLTVDTSGNIKGYVNDALVVSASDSTYTSFSYVGVRVSRAVQYDLVKIYKLADPADVSSFQTGSFSSNVTNLKLYLNGNLAASYSGTLNETNPSSGKIAITDFWQDGNNSLYFNATGGNFDAVVEFNYTLSVSEVRDETFDYLKINSSFYIENGSYNTAYSTSFTTTYDYSIRIWVNGNETSNFTTSETVSGSNRTVTINLDVGNQSGNIDVYIYVNFVASTVLVRVLEENTNNPISNQPVQLLDTNYNLIVSATSNSTGYATLETVYWGYAYVKAGDTTSYLPRQVKIYVPNAGNVNATVYLVNASGNAVQIIFELQDFTGRFSNSELIIKKYLSRENLVEIHTDKFDAMNRVSSYLLIDNNYLLSISNGNEVREIGWYKPAYATTETISIHEVSFPLKKIGDYIQWNLTYDNTSISVAWQTLNGTLNYFKVLIYNQTNNLVFSDNTTAQSGTITYVHNDSSINYLVRVEFSHESLSPHSSSYLILYNTSQKFGIWSEKIPDWIKSWAAYATVIGVVCLFSMLHAEIGMFISLALLGFWTYVGWARINAYTLAVLGFIVFAGLIRHWRREG